VAGPGGPQRFVPGARYYLLFGDPSAMAALASVLAKLPADAIGHAFIDIADHSEIQPLRHPPGVQLHWLTPGSGTLEDAARSLQWPSVSVSVTLAGESSQVVAVRQHLLRERALPPESLYAVPYWKARHTEEAYHAERHQIMDRFEAEDKLEIQA
jgi:NADPH-dependent ferric siderophore reductase